MSCITDSSLCSWRRGQRKWRLFEILCWYEYFVNKASLRVCVCVCGGGFTPVCFITAIILLIILSVTSSHLSDLQWRHWTPYDLSVLLISASQHTPSPAASFSLGFQYFDKNKFNPALSFMKFHEEFVLRSNYEECWKYLQEFNNARDNVSVCM